MDCFGFALAAKDSDQGGNAVIERPLTTNQLMRFGYEIYDPDFDKVKNDWSHIPMLRLWNHGYNKSVLLTWFSSFPPELVSILKRTLGLAHHVLVARISHLETVKGMYKVPDTVPSFDVKSDSEDMELVWFDQAPHAGLRVCYDPVTQARTSVSVNMMHSHLMQMHREEYMARIGNHDMSFPMPAIDFLCMAVDDMLQISVDKLDRYVRYSRIVNGERKAMLVFTSKIRRYNSIGQVVEVL
jgi:hypothetical protein